MAEVTLCARDWNSLKNILCVRLDNMGDVLMSQPAMRALKETVPSRKITLLTSTSGASIARFIPEVDEIIPFDVPWMKGEQSRDAQSSDEGTGKQQLLALVHALESQRFEAAVIFTVYSQNPLPAAMLCYQAGIETVLGYCRENPYQLISHWVPDREPLDFVLHEVERQLRLVESIGAGSPDTRLRLQIDENSKKKMLETLSSAGIRLDEPWLVLHAGVSEEKRRYSDVEYINACRSLIAQGYKIALTGSLGERRLAAEIAYPLGANAVNFAGKLSLAELIALVGLAPVLVSNNTGPVHIAAAVGTPVVVLYAMTNPQHTPWQVPNRVLYFEVPARLRSKNRFLQSFPGRSMPRASAGAIQAAVNELTRTDNGSERYRTYSVL